MTSHIETLVQQLDGKADESYDARAELIWIGADGIPAVINGLPSLGGLGQLTVIEVFEEVGDPLTWTATADEILAKVRLVQTSVKKLVNHNSK